MKKKFISYAQFIEDWILYCALENIKNGFYVDVGANDPCFFSVTKAFYDMGWKGINIEPLKVEYDKLCLDRPKDINLNIGVGAENTSIEFYILGSDTTCDLETALRFGTVNSLKKEIIPVKRLSDVLDKHLANKDKTIHFLKIDVEGFERSVLEGMDFNKFRPWIIVVEATLPGTGIPCHDKWEDILLTSNYELGIIYGINRYYVDKLLDRKINQKLKSGLGAYWIKATKYEIEQKYPQKYSNITEFRRFKLRRFIHEYIQNHDNLISTVFRGIRIMYRGIKTAIKSLLR